MVPSGPQFRDELSPIKSYRELGHDIEIAAARRLPSIARVVVQNHKSKAKSPPPSFGTEILMKSMTSGDLQTGSEENGVVTERLHQAIPNRAPMPG
jgi:hypothetical protein